MLVSRDGLFGAYMMASKIPERSQDPEERKIQMVAQAKYHRFFEPTLIDGPNGRSSIIAYTNLLIEGEDTDYKQAK